ncbi:MAG: nucleotidyltransferase domain-containing protein [Planctomycetaceae bacterium]|jgi:predicted nucleotidyltransferase|nr:nucleotidyltransferase domain-containing protein [Planctomycetaceae bacterium]
MSNVNTNSDISVVLDKIVECILGSEFPILRIILFGSHAKGTATQDSDIDLMVVIDNDVIVSSYREKMDRALSIRKSLREIDYAKDLIVYSRKELNIVKERGYDFIKEIEQTGKILYERTN